MSMPVDRDPTSARETLPAPSEDRSLGELIAELSRETTDLVRQEMDLAKTELTYKATEAGKDVAFLTAGGAVIYAGFLAIVAACILGLIQLGVTWWLAALLVGLVVAGIGGYLVWKGLDALKHMSPMPERTIETLKGDAQWAKGQTR